MKDPLPTPDSRNPGAVRGDIRGHLIGVLFIAVIAAIGIYIATRGIGRLSRGPNDAPGWVLAVAGAAFLFAAASMAISAIGGILFGATARRDGSLGDDAPYGLRLAQMLLSLGIVALLASVATWVAFNPGPGGAGRSIVFAFGAVCAWLIFFALAVWKLRAMHK